MARSIRLAEKSGSLSRGLARMSRVQQRAITMLLDIEFDDAERKKADAIKLALLTANPQQLFDLWPELRPPATEADVNKVMDGDGPTETKTNLSAEQAMALLAKMGRMTATDLEIKVDA